MNTLAHSNQRVLYHTTSFSLLAKDHSFPANQSQISTEKIKTTTYNELPQEI